MKEKLKTEAPGEMSDINTEDETSLHVSTEVYRVLAIQCVHSLHAKVKEVLSSHKIKLKKCTSQ